MNTFLSIALVPLAAAYAPGSAVGGHIAAHARRVAPIVASDLQSFLTDKAGISPKFVPQVMATCEEEMVGSVANLETLEAAGMLDSVFKPVIVASIRSALSAPGSGAVAAVVGGGAATMTVGTEAYMMPMSEVKRLLMASGQDTWGGELALRNRLDMFVQQDYQSSGAQWDAATQTWSTPTAIADPSAGAAVAASGPFTVPVTPSTFDGAQWSPAAPPAGDKSTYTVTLKTPDGDLAFECPPDDYMLDATEELDNADDFADLPFACRAGSCSACAGTLVSGTVDTSDCTFLSPDQIAKGFILTCTAKPTSDCVIQTHTEDDLY
jgi:ferredoxin